VFNFKNVQIDNGKTVKGQGSNPMVWLVSGSFEVAGTLSVDGGQGTRVQQVTNANVPKPGGAGVCGGGDGGRGSPSSTARDVAGETGNGPLQVALGGGVGGTLACAVGCNRGSGGGGGSLATQGDPNYKRLQIPPAPGQNVFPIFPQQLGVGGNGCLGVAGSATRNLFGGTPGSIVFVDSRADNNYWGGGYNVFAKLRIVGELSVPIGGGGGGGGGDKAYNSECNNVPNFANDSSGGGGGGGGGVLIVKALGPITVFESGRISADGGHGGGGEEQASCNQGGGGGGGAGGMVVLMSATAINIHAKGPGNTYIYAAQGLPGSGIASPQNDFNFSISADGGVCRTLTHQTPGSPTITSVGKYNVTALASAGTTFQTQYDSAPLGGLGGMGVVQLIAPPGPRAPADNTNTILDDNINVFRSGSPVNGLAKQSVLAWRGFPNAQGQGLDDQGNPVPVPNPQNPLDYEGDIRPAPLLLPTPFAEKSRLRTHWIDTGASVRRSVASNDGFPRGIIDTDPPTLAGPRYLFAGLRAPATPTDPTAGYVDYDVVNLQARAKYPEVVPPAPITGTGATTFDGEPAYFVRTAEAFGTPVGQFSQFEAELLNDNNLVQGSFRILANTESELTLSAEGGALPVTATKVRVRSKFFKLVTNGTEGLGNTYPGSAPGGERVPIANVRIGFAFHQDPANPAAPRWPAAPNTFEYNLADPAVQESIRTLGGANGGAAFVQYDLLFDLRFKVLSLDEPPALAPTTQRPELHFLRLPFRF
ncbi:MAG TPA: hypothetical protein VFT55_03575, partial [Planctomycetota bacterium]|nr:hypothetical protein [Planctomycetota bacterium]